jgi:ABC-type sugar transport system ATPase subunit
MAKFGLERITKVYPNGFKAVHALDLEINEGELMVLLRPSGCAQTGSE